MALPGLLKIGTRGSRLALVQTQTVAEALQKKHPKLKIKIQTITTSGDRLKGEAFKAQGGKGLFAKEIEEALLSGEIDCGVHSLKDLPAFLPDGLILACFPKRADPRDLFISAQYKNLETLPRGAIIGTGSPRRQAQLRSQAPHFRIETVRGNVDTRLRKLAEGKWDALVLAAAGLERLKKKTTSYQSLNPNVFVPAAGQGILTLEIKAGQEELTQLLQKALNDRETEWAARAERAFLKTIGGDCYTPLGGFCRREREEWKITGWLGLPDGKKFVCLEEKQIEEGPEALGEKLGRRLLAQGGKEILDAIVADPAR
ncbi:MAG: hydroxymethylbilane synthase [Deltaproteobacteria bacterium]|nr:hydroxymethylbilane synthase [Deltaproteobacteria bacterium]